MQPKIARILLIVIAIGLWLDAVIRVSHDPQSRLHRLARDPLAFLELVSGEYSEIRSRSQGGGDSGNGSQIWRSILTYSRPDPDRLEFRGDLAGEPVVIDMRKVDVSKFTLVSTGFHWVHDGPFYR